MTKPHYISTCTLALFTVLFAAGCGADGGRTLSAPEAFAKAQTGEITLIDIRTPGEWRQTDVSDGAMTIDMTTKTFVTEILEAVDGYKNAPIAISCLTGNRTTYTQTALREMGFSRVYRVNEGMAGSGTGPGWIRRGLPVNSCQTC